MFENVFTSWLLPPPASLCRPLSFWWESHFASCHRVPGCGRSRPWLRARPWEPQENLRADRLLPGVLGDVPCTLSPGGMTGNCPGFGSMGRPAEGPYVVGSSDSKGDTAAPGSPRGNGASSERSGRRGRGLAPCPPRKGPRWSHFRFGAMMYTSWGDETRHGTPAQPCAACPAPSNGRTQPLPALCVP